MLEKFFASGHVADAILLLMALEALAIIILIRRLKSLSSAGILLAGVAAGACLVLALRAALKDAAWQTVALFLILALVAHVVELRLWFGSRGPSSASRAGFGDKDHR